MKNLLLLCTAILVFATSFGQTEKNSPISSCSSDCLLGECRIKCPEASVPACTCIIGMFSSCKCLESIMLRVSASDYELIVRRSDAKVQSVNSFLRSKNDSAFSAAINGAYAALKSNNQQDYETYLTTLENLVKANPRLADDVHQYVKTLK